MLENKFLDVMLVPKSCNLYVSTWRCDFFIVLIRYNCFHLQGFICRDSKTARTETETKNGNRKEIRSGI